MPVYRDGTRVDKPVKTPKKKQPKYTPPGQAPGSSFGITPEAVDKYYADPKNDPAGKFRPTWEANRESAYAGAASSAQAQQAAWVARIEASKAQAHALAKKWAQAATDINLALKGQKDNQAALRQAEVYGFDYKSKEGRLRAQEFAKQAMAYSLKAGTDQGADNLVQFDKAVHENTKNWRHASFVKEQAGIADEVRQEERARDPYGNMVQGGFNALTDKLGLTDYESEKGPNSAPSGKDILPGLARGLAPVEYVFERLGAINSSYSAYQYSKTHGGDFGDQVGAFLGGVAKTGLGLDQQADWYLSDEAIGAIEKTDTYSERERLTKRGDLISFGQYYTGQWDSLNYETRKGAEANAWDRWMDPSMKAANRAQRSTINEAFQVGNVNLLSGGMDAAWQYYSDPLTIGGKAMKAAGFAGDIGKRAIEKSIAENLAKAGSKAKLTDEVVEAATYAARNRYATEHVVGRAVVEETLHGLGRIHAGGNVDRVLSALGRAGTGREFAARVSEAMLNGTPEAVNKLLVDGFASGVWRPERNLTGQILRRLGYKGSAGAHFVPQLADKFREWGNQGKFANDVFDPTTGERLIQKGTRKFTTVTPETSHVKVMYAAVERVAMQTYQFGGSIVERAAQRSVIAPAQRLRELMDLSDEIGIPNFQLIMAKVARGFNSSTKTWADFTVAEQDEFLRALDYADTVAYLLKGGEGEEAKSIVIEQLTRGYKPLVDQANDTRKLLSDALQGAWGADLDFNAQADRIIKNLTPAEERVLIDAASADPDVRGWLMDRLMDAERGSKEWRVLMQGAIVIADDGTGRVGREILRLSDLGSHQKALRAVIDEAAVKHPNRLIRTVSGLVPSVVDKATLKTLRTFSSPYMGERQGAVADFFIRYAQALHPSREELNQVRLIAERVGAHTAAGGSSRGAQKLLQDLVAMPFLKAGLTKEDAAEWAKVHANDFFSQSVSTRNRAFLAVVDDGADLTTELTAEDFRLLNDRPLVGTQVRTEFTPPEIHRIEEGVRNALMKGYQAEDGKLLAGLKHPITQVEVRWDKVKGASITIFGKERTVRGGINSLLRLWKVMVTTKMMLPLIAVPAIGISTGDWGDAFLFGGLAAGAGLIRYKARMSLQNRIDGVLYHGFAPPEWIPGLSRIYTKIQRKQYGYGANGLLANQEAASWENGVVGRFVRGKDTEWKAVVPVGRKGRRQFVEGYHRAINFQLNPEEDEVIRILLNHKAGTLNDAQRDRALKNFLDSEEGVLWKQKNRTTTAKNAQRAVDAIVPDAGVARLRLERYGPGKSISHKELDELLAAGKLPKGIHYQDSEAIWNEPRQLWNKFKAAYDAAAYDSARSINFRETFFAVERETQLASLRAAGVPRKQAEEMAGELALRRTNDVMFRYDNVSRFAHAVDWIAPFTGHRMFNVQSWGRAIIQNPGRAIRITELSAKAFNSAVASDIFYKNDSGDWSMTIPGQGVLSQLMGKSNLDQYVSLKGFLAMTGELDRSISTGNPVIAAAEMASPHPGGLWWVGAGRVIKEAAPELVGEDSPLPHFVKDFLFPYGVATNFLTPEAGRYMRLMVGDGGVWNLLDDGQSEEELHRIEIQLINDDIASHLLKHPEDTMYFPSDERIKEMTVSFLETWQVFQSLSPASPHPRFQTREKYQELWDAWLGPLADKPMSSREYQKQRRMFLAEHPAYYPYLTSSGQWQDSGFEDWRKSTEVADNMEASFAKLNMAAFEGRRRVKTVPEYRRIMRELRKRDEAQAAWTHANGNPNAAERERELARVDQKFPDQSKYFRTRAHAEEDLARIINGYPPGAIRDEAIDRWRHKYAPKGSQTVSKTSFDTMKRKVEDYQRKTGATFTASAWSLARPGNLVWKSTRKQIDGPLVRRDGTLNPMTAIVVATLPPVEQYYFYLEAIAHIDQDSDLQADTARSLTIYGALKKAAGAVAKNNQKEMFGRPSAYPPSESSMYKDRLRAIASAEYTDISDMWTESKRQSDEMSRMADAGEWGSFWPLKKKHDEFKEAIRIRQSEQWNSKQGQLHSADMHDALREWFFVNSLPGDHGDAEKDIQNRINMLKLQGYEFASSNESARYLAMPPATRRNFINDIFTRLNEAPGLGSETWAINESHAWALGLDGVGGGKFSVPTKLYWSMLTDFQRDLLEKNAPQEQLDAWKGVDKATAEKAAKDAKGGSGGYGRGGRGGGGGDELSYAYAMMKQYSKRGGMAKPAGYAEYLAIGNNPALRRDFLDKHPDVAAYVKAGPLANMPPVIQMIVADIMVRNGKWEGEPRDMGELTDIAFAREQLSRYNRRTGPAPGTYDLWLNMPTGQAKADYLLQHPEIKAWIQLGPMANMPEAYKDVVRDIMYRYHEWTASTDGMGEVLSGYFRTPSYARKQYLDQHPELAAYWAATRSPADEAIGMQVDAYYATADPGAKAAMLSANPQLKEYFLNSRTRRYEKFLNQVAQYMGSNPALFEHYLQEQTKVMGDLLNKFATPNLAREQHWLKPPKVAKKSTEGGRTRA